MSRTRVLIAGAAGRGFHNFNLVYRDRPEYEVVAFTATQIPNNDGRRYPPELAGSLYQDGIPILPESALEQLVREHEIDSVVFAYSDVHDVLVRHARRLARACRRRVVPPDLAARHDARVRQAGRRDLRGADGLRQEPDHAPRRTPLPRQREARRGAAPPDAVRRPRRAGGAAVRALPGPRGG